MIKKISSLLLIVLVSLFVVTGCDSDKTDNSSTTKKIDSLDDLNDSKKGILNCTREASLDGGTGEFNYVISYKGDNLTSIYSIEAITSDDSAVLDEYEEAYKKIDSYYKDLEYHNNTTKRNNNTVTHIIDIDYEKVDIKKLVELEGEEDNIFVNYEPKLDKYFELAKKLGITCSESAI